MWLVWVKRSPLLCGNLLALANTSGSCSFVNAKLYNNTLPYKSSFFLPSQPIPTPPLLPLIPLPTSLAHTHTPSYYLYWFFKNMLQYTSLDNVNCAYSLPKVIDQKPNKIKRTTCYFSSREVSIGWMDA